MSCPHPSAPVERVVGSRVDLVCRDCHARFEPVTEAAPDEGEILPSLVELLQSPDIDELDSPDESDEG